MSFSEAVEQVEANCSLFGGVFSADIRLNCLEREVRDSLILGFLKQDATYFEDTSCEQLKVRTLTLTERYSVVLTVPKIIKNW